MSRFLLVEERDYSCCSTRTTSLLPPRQRLDTGARNAEYAAHTPLPMTRCFLDDTRFTNGRRQPPAHIKRRNTGPHGCQHEIPARRSPVSYYRTQEATHI